MSFENIHQKNPEDFAVNELNKQNTYQGSKTVEFTHRGFLFRLGCWPTVVNGAEHPFFALLVATGNGPVVLETGGFLYNDSMDIDVNGTVDKQDLDHFMWLLENKFSPAFQKFLQENEQSDIPLSNWGKALLLLETVQVNADDSLEFENFL